MLVLRRVWLRPVVVVDLRLFDLPRLIRRPSVWAFLATPECCGPVLLRRLSGWPARVSLPLLLARRPVDDLADLALATVLPIRLPELILERLWLRLLEAPTLEALERRRSVDGSRATPWRPVPLICEAVELRRELTGDELVELIPESWVDMLMLLVLFSVVL